MSEDELSNLGSIRPCQAAMGVCGVPARRWLTKADLFEQLEDARRFMDAHALEGTSLRECAKVAGQSMHHFLRLFHEVHGKTPHRYLVERKVAAVHLLLGSSANVSQIALDAGFSSSSAFGRWFKAETGMTPSAYRRSKSQLR